MSDGVLGLLYDARDLEDAFSKFPALLPDRRELRQTFRIVFDTAVLIEAGPDARSLPALALDLL